MMHRNPRCRLARPTRTAFAASRGPAGRDVGVSPRERARGDVRGAAGARGEGEPHEGPATRQAGVVPADHPVPDHRHRHVPPVQRRHHERAHQGHGHEEDAVPLPHALRAGQGGPGAAHREHVAERLQRRRSRRARIGRALHGVHARPRPGGVPGAFASRARARDEETHRTRTGPVSGSAATPPPPPSGGKSDIARRARTGSPFSFVRRFETRSFFSPRETVQP